MVKQDVFIVRKKRGEKMKIKILIDTISKVQEFYKLAQSFIGNAIVTSGRYRVDGKSLIGLFSLDLSVPVYVETDYDNAEQAEMLFERFKVN